MCVADPWTEPGRWVADDGAIRYDWPPQGRFAGMWERFREAFPDESEWSEVHALFLRWQHENSTLVAYTDGGEWVDVEPDWSLPERWVNG